MCVYFGVEILRWPGHTKRTSWYSESSANERHVSVTKLSSCCLGFRMYGLKDWNCFRQANIAHGVNWTGLALTSPTRCRMLCLTESESKELVISARACHFTSLYNALACQSRLQENCSGPWRLDVGLQSIHHRNHWCGHHSQEVPLHLQTLSD